MSGEIFQKNFSRDGFAIVQGLCDLPTLNKMRTIAQRDLVPLTYPAEFEADLGYPGAPESRHSKGGHTVRRLLSACDRDDCFFQWAISPILKPYLQNLLDSRRVCMSRVHHNCLMTKHPGYSSATLWHRDIRYWEFDHPELISVWLALGKEEAKNGALKMIPGSHNYSLSESRLDDELFLRTDLTANRKLIDESVVIELEPGDVVFFSCNVLHAAEKNLSDEIKFSLVTTYHAGGNKPIPDTRSATLPSVLM